MSESRCCCCGADDCDCIEENFNGAHSCRTDPAVRELVEATEKLYAWVVEQHWRSGDTIPGLKEVDAALAKFGKDNEVDMDGLDWNV